MSSTKSFSQAIFFITSLITTMCFFGNFAIVNASPETVVYVEPAEVKDLLPPTQFSIFVKVANVTNLYGIDVQFTWEPTIIKYVSHKKHIPVETNPDGVLHSPTIPVKDQVDESASMPGAEPGTRYWLAEASILPAAAFDGSGVIFEMKFEVVGLGSSPLRIVACTLSDKNGDPIPHTLKHGYFVNYVPPPADIFVNPKSIINASLTPCQNFTVSINISNVENLYSFDLWLGYNASILEAVDIAVNPIFSSVTTKYETGQIEVSASLTPPNLPVSGDFYLAFVKFHVLAEGESVLDLHDISLLDDKGNAIDFNEPEDGYFNNMAFYKILATVEIEPGVLNFEGNRQIC